MVELSEPAFNAIAQETRLAVMELIRQHLMGTVEGQAGQQAVVVGALGGSVDCFAACLKRDVSCDDVRRIIRELADEMAGHAFDALHADESAA